MLQPRICLLGVLPFRPIIRIGCRPNPAQCGLDHPAARARRIAGARTTPLHGSAVLGSARVHPWSEVISSRACWRPRCASATNQKQQQPVQIVRVSMLDLRCVALHYILLSRPLTDATDVARCLCAVINSASTGAQSPV